MIPHGTVNGYVHHDCRCPPCRSEWATYVRAKRRSRTIAPDDPRHGKRTTYVNYLCRCPPCTAAHTQYGRDYKRNRAAT